MECRWWIPLSFVFSLLFFPSTLFALYFLSMVVLLSLSCHPPTHRDGHIHAILFTLCSLEFAVELKVPVSRKKCYNNLSWMGTASKRSGLPQGLHRHIAQLVRELDDGAAGPGVRFGMLCNFATTVFARMDKSPDNAYTLKLWRLDVTPPSPRAQAGQPKMPSLTESRGFTVDSLVMLASAIRRFVFWGR